MPETIVIAGAGHAAGQTAVSLRQGGFDGALIIVGEEAYPPYQRPPLSKKYLAGEMALERLYLRPEKFYAGHDVELRLSTRVEAIDRDAHRVTLSDGSEIGYDKLVIATGSHVRRLELPGGDLRGVNYLRTIADVQAIQGGFEPGARLAIIGAGYIGLEVAAVAVKAGLQVTVFEVADRVMARVVAPETSEFYAREHRAAGVDLRLSAPAITRLEGANTVQAVVDENGDTMPVDMVVIGIGVLPTTDIAAAAGLECNNGIVVDEFCQTADADILAIGDCTNHPNALLGGRLRLESVHNAQEQAKTAAQTLLGKPVAYAQVPWFWSDQYDLKLQITGIASGTESRVVRGSPDERSFAVFYFDQGRITVVEAVNSPREFMVGKKLIAAGAKLDPAAVADPETDIKALTAAALA